MKKDYLSRGFSLVEVLMALGILAIILIGTLVAATNFTNISSRGRDAVEMLEENRWAMDCVAREAKYARAISVNANGDVLTLININSTATAYDNIVTYSVGNDGALYRKSASDNVVTAVTNPGIAILSAPNTFKMDGTKLIINMNFTTGSGTKLQTQAIQTEVFPLNSKVSGPD